MVHIIEGRFHKAVIGKFKNSPIPQECLGCSNNDHNKNNSQKTTKKNKRRKCLRRPCHPCFNPKKNTITVNSSSRVACKFAVDLPTSTSPNVQLAVQLQVGVVGVVNGELSRIRKIKMDQIDPNNPCMYGIFTYMNGWFFMVDVGKYSGKYTIHGWYVLW